MRECPRCIAVLPAGVRPPGVLRDGDELLCLAHGSFGGAEPARRQVEVPLLLPLDAEDGQLVFEEMMAS